MEFRGGRQGKVETIVAMSSVRPSILRDEMR